MRYLSFLLLAIPIPFVFASGYVPTYEDSALIEKVVERLNIYIEQKSRVDESNVLYALTLFNSKVTGGRTGYILDWAITYYQNKSDPIYKKIAKEVEKLGGEFDYYYLKSDVTGFQDNGACELLGGNESSINNCTYFGYRSPNCQQDAKQICDFNRWFCSNVKDKEMCSKFPSCQRGLTLPEGHCNGDTLTEIGCPEIFIPGCVG